MFGAYRTTTSQPPTDLVEDTDNAFMVLDNAIIRGQQAGVMRADDLKQLARCLALVHGLAMLLMDGQIPGMNPQSVMPLSTPVTQLLIQGIAIASKP